MVIARGGASGKFETVPGIVWKAVLLNGAGVQVTAYTNLDTAALGAAKYLKVMYATNADGTANATNVVLRLIKKTIKPSP